jgi:DNA helicase-2/ATP-dependent DNA helicase PcrA
VRVITSKIKKNFMLNIGENMNYSKEQEEIIFDQSNFKQVIAAAGSGKTSTMIALVETVLNKKQIAEESILLITFTRKATNEIKERLEAKIGKNRVKIYTFHAYCFYILKKYNPEFNKEKIQIIEDEERKLFLRNFFIKEKFKVGGIPYELLLGSTDRFLKTYFPELEMELERAYKEYKILNSKLDFNDLVRIYLEGLKEKMTWAIEASKEVQFVIVDEFQDTDFEQLEWLQLLSPSKLTVVGDDWQAIYGFRGATSEPFLKFNTYFPETKKFFLKTNYRSLKEIIHVSSIPLSKNKSNIKKKVQEYRKGKANLGKFKINSEEDILSIIKWIQKYPKEYILLCRSNFRIHYFNQLGIPEKNTMTIHAAKGLEFDTVFVDLSSGWNAMNKSDSTFIEEERRILYVALSRAKNSLYLIGNKELDKDNSLEDLFFSYFKFKIKEIALE